MITALLVILGVICYLHVGYHLGDIGVKTWLAKDQDSLRSFLLFPVSHHKKRVGVVGDKALAPVGQFDLENKKKDSTGPTGYKIWMTLIWPLKFLINLPAYVLYGAIDGARAAAVAMQDARTNSIERRRTMRENAFAPSTSDDVRALFDKRQAVVGEMRLLAARKEAIDAELESRKAEMDAILEVEGSVDPDVRRLAAGDKGR